MKVEKTCTTCNKKYLVDQYRSEKSRFCSRDCANAGQRKLERRDIKCEACKTVFNAIQDHGVWPKFCSRKCFKSTARHFNCEHCGKKTRQNKSQPNKFCSVKCKKSDTIARHQRKCAICGTEFLIKNKHQTGMACSMKCAGELFSGEHSKSWKGGSYIDYNGKVVVRIDKKKYRHLHRIIADDILGRKIQTNEVVFHINKNFLDNRPENLYICSMAEFKKIQLGNLATPTSNLSPLTYLQPKKRGQTCVFQERKTPKRDDLKCRPPTGAWTKERKKWMTSDRSNGAKTRGTPDSQNK